MMRGMASLEKLVEWAQHADPAARADAAHQLRSFASADPLSCSEATRILITLLCDPHPEVANVALVSLLDEGAGRQRWGREPPAVLVAGLASPHLAIRDLCWDRLGSLALSWEVLAELGIEPSRAIELVSPQALIAAVRDARPWSPLALQEIARRQIQASLPLPDLRELRRALAGAGSDTSGVTKVMDDKRRAARRNRSVPRASKLAHLSDFLTAIRDEDDERAHELSYELSGGDFAALPAEFARTPPELQTTVIEFVGQGIPAGLFFLLAHLGGPHKEVAARGIANLCEIYPDEVALTAAEFAIVKRWTPGVVEPFVDDN